MHIFIDESGDLGTVLKQGASKYFVVVALATTRPKLIRKIAKQEYRRGMRLRRNNSLVLHAYKEKDSVRKRVLKALVDRDCVLHCFYLDKSVLLPYKLLHPDKLYNDLLIEISSKLRQAYGHECILTVERKHTNTELNNDLLSAKLNIVSPVSEKCIQVVDFCSWAFFRNLEFEDDVYFSIVRKWVKEVVNLSYILQK